MQGKQIGVIALVIIGVYFLIFHTAPLPLNHEAIGLPPYHVIHAVFGLVLLAVVGYVWKKK